jgi:hypothetical protein
MLDRSIHWLGSCSKMIEEFAEGRRQQQRRAG